ncbi:MAG TPA: thioredoxin family protein [Polyangiaceae bacterium]
MAAVPSSMLSLGTALPKFSLPDTVTNRVVSSDELAGKPIVVAFICNHCPYVKHIQAGLAEFGRYCQQNGVNMVAISSNDIRSYPDDAPDRMAAEARRGGFVFPYLYDESQDVAKAFHAACTPDLYLFDLHRKLVYRGQFDDSRPGNKKPVTGADLRHAVDAVLAGGKPTLDQRPSIGCNIKWR